MARAAIPLEERLAALIAVDPDTGCWIYQAHIRKDGYGSITVGSRTDGSRKNQLVHRVSYETFVGPVPDGLTLDHLCRRRACINPAHLEPVTGKANVLRGETITAANAIKTHCIHGHAYTPENTGFQRNGRYCKQCHREQALAHYHKQKGQ
jgi:hypothetical protein